MLKGFEARSIAQFHDRQLCDASAPAADPGSGAWGPIAANHRYNGLLWNEEDQARRTDVGAAAIAHSKRLIDQYNQSRNDAVEAIDEALLALLADAPRAENARLHSETAGAMIDRLSILSLKIYHMGEQTRRTDVATGHVERCAARLRRLSAQRQDLMACFDQLLADARAGRAYFKVYRQFKMYNDPALNPCLYGQRQPGGAPGSMP